MFRSGEPNRVYKPSNEISDAETNQVYKPGHTSHKSERGKRVRGFLGEAAHRIKSTSPGKQTQTENQPKVNISAVCKRNAMLNSRHSVK